MAVGIQTHPKQVNHILIEQPATAQLAREEGHATGIVEIVDVCRAVGVNTSQQWHYRRQLVHVLPGEVDTGCARNSDQVQGVIGRAARGEQADNCVNQRSFRQYL